MKKIASISFCIAFVLVFSVHVTAQDCTTIQDGTLTTSDGELLAPGFSQWGYNYQAYIFNGMWCDYHPLYRPGGDQHEWCMANYGDVELIMKWNDAWLSNKDCDGDGLLDRYYGCPSYIGSGAWCTNHMKGTYEQDGKICKWVYFTKIVAVPSDAYCDQYHQYNRCIGTWYTASGTEIGPSIWNTFATIQSVYNDKCGGDHGIEYLSPAGPGVGSGHIQ